MEESAASTGKALVVDPGGGWCKWLMQVFRGDMYVL